MNVFRLVYRNITGSPLRSGLVVACVCLIAVCAVWAELVLHNTRANLQQNLANLQRFEPGVVVIPRATGSANTRQVLVELERLVEKLRAVPGVQTVSPQLQLLRVESAPGPFTLIAFDPLRNRSVLARLAQAPGSPDEQGALAVGAAIAGRAVALADATDPITLNGYSLQVRAALAETGTTLDQAVFVTFETAQELAQHVNDNPGGATQVTLLNTPTLLVNFSPGVDGQMVINQILKEIPGVTIFDSARFFLLGREQLRSLQADLPTLLAAAWGLGVVCIGLLFALAANERRREIGVLRALGSTRAFVVQVVLAEGLLLALVGGGVGLLMGLLSVALANRPGGPLGPLAMQPLSGWQWLGLALVCLASALGSVLLACGLPAWQASRQDPTFQMKG